MTKEGATMLLQLGAAHATLVGWVLVVVTVLSIVGCILLWRVGRRGADEMRVFGYTLSAIFALATGLAAYHAVTFLREPMFWAYRWLFRGK